MSAQPAQTPEQEEQPEASSSGELLEPISSDRSLVPIKTGWFNSDSNSLFGWLAGLFTRRRNGSTMRDDLADALSDEESTAQGFSPEERAMLTSILRMEDLRIEELMVPRTDIIAVSQDITLAELLKIFEDSGHSRMPVFDDNLDDPRGMVHIRDVVAHLTKAATLPRGEASKRRKKPPANLDFKKVDLSKPIAGLKLLREVMFVPPSMGARELMARMQAERVQIALVIDEYGGTDGLVTLEDIVEEIVGDIEDEHDDEQSHIKEQGDGTFLCDAKAELDDIRALIGEDFAFGEHEEDVDTIGGLIFDILGRVPVRGEVIVNNGFEFRVVEADPRRIRRVELVRSSRRRSKPQTVQAATS
ncbi:MAG: hemolysin family protein [Pseudomonadota bacterium]